MNEKIDFDRIDNNPQHSTIDSNAAYKLRLIKFKDKDGNISSVQSFEDFDRFMSDPNMTLVF